MKLQGSNTALGGQERQANVCSSLVLCLRRDCMVVRERTSRAGAQALAVVWHLCVELNVREHFITTFMRTFQSSAGMYTRMRSSGAASPGPAQKQP